MRSLNCVVIVLMVGCVQSTSAALFPDYLEDFIQGNEATEAGTIFSSWKFEYSNQYYDPTDVSKIIRQVERVGNCSQNELAFISESRWSSEDPRTGAPRLETHKVAKTTEVMAWSSYEDGKLLNAEGHQTKIGGGLSKEATLSLARKSFNVFRESFRIRSQESLRQSFELILSKPGYSITHEVLEDTSLESITVHVGSNDTIAYKIVYDTSCGYVITSIEQQDSAKIVRRKVTIDYVTNEDFIHPKRYVETRYEKTSRNSSAYLYSVKTCNVLEATADSSDVDNLENLNLENGKNIAFYTEEGKLTKRGALISNQKLHAVKNATGDVELSTGAPK